MLFGTGAKRLVLHDKSENIIGLKRVVRIITVSLILSIL